VVVEGPYGGFWHEGEAIREQVWIAGGIGVTPFLAMARSLDLSERAIDFYYCTVDSDSAVFLDELRDLAARNPGLRLETVPFDTEGFLTADRVAATSGDLSRRHVFLCTGPRCCTPEVGAAAWEALKTELKNANLGDACQRSKVGCLRICCHGPTMVVYPEGTWYHGMTADRIPLIVKEHLVENRPDTIRIEGGPTTGPIRLGLDGVRLAGDRLRLFLNGGQFGCE
jgi:(2Fe-2S) ferredoxin